MGYARVSTADQNPDLQSDALSAAGCFKVWTDIASGAKTDRPELAALMDVLRSGDTLVVWRLDRLGRSLPHLIETIAELEQRGVAFRSLTESIDTSTAGGRLIFHVFGALADFERSLIRERTVAGLAAARERGRVGGRPAALTPAKKRQANKVRAEGVPMSEIAEVLKVARSTLYRHLGYTWMEMDGGGVGWWSRWMVGGEVFTHGGSSWAAGGLDRLTDRLSHLTRAPDHTNLDEFQSAGRSSGTAHAVVPTVLRAGDSVRIGWPKTMSRAPDRSGEHLRHVPAPRAVGQGRRPPRTGIRLVGRRSAPPYRVHATNEGTPPLSPDV
ncbi:Site-specific DNA recombinase [Rhodococcus tukisamuensis]|uniref:Site-specific DNA recombinase n=1 Tax=Rhodococcus tukisamuensis TaxID=168276 RepID=A0A1G6T5M4_9NOCA|nr:Site-specific DNA recombinase [Rhodococcus tukisamuensis]